MGSSPALGIEHTTSGLQSQQANTTLITDIWYINHTQFLIKSMQSCFCSTHNDARAQESIWYPDLIFNGIDL